jgi:hypothetical protein
VGKERGRAQSGVIFACNGFTTNPGLYDVRERAIIEALESSVPARDELRGILGRP